MSGVSKQFGAVTALGDIELEVHAGEVVALVGDNGAGKTTLVKVLAGVHQPTSGMIEYLGDEVTIDNPSARGSCSKNWRPASRRSASPSHHFPAGSDKQLRLRVRLSWNLK